MGDTVIRVEGVAKKFCKRLRHSMYHGAVDVARGMLGMESRTDVLRQGEFWAVEDVSFELKRGDTLGLIGPNGSGKSTLLRLLNGIFPPDRGRIEIRGRVGALIAVGAGFHPLMTGRENIYLNGAIMGMGRKEIDRKFDAIVDFADIEDFLDAPVKTYSSGMYVRLGFAVAIHCEPDILLVDEVLAVGDAGFQKKCFDFIGRLRSDGVSVVLVTHNMHQLSSFAGKTLVLASGREVYSGEADEAIDIYWKLTGPGVDGMAGSTERVVTSGEKFSADSVRISPERVLTPGETLVFEIDYEASEDLDGVEMDLALVRAGVPGLYFQGNSRSVGRTFNLSKGRGTLKAAIGPMPINGGRAGLAVAIWEKDRKGLLFWWRNIPLEFGRAEKMSGENFIPLSFSSSVEEGSCGVS